MNSLASSLGALHGNAEFWLHEPAKAASLGAHPQETTTYNGKLTAGAKRRFTVMTGNDDYNEKAGKLVQTLPSWQANPIRHLEMRRPPQV